MSIDPASLLELLGTHIAQGVDKVKRGHIRIETAFIYPDGSSIDLFLIEHTLFIPCRLTDFGQTMSWLLTAQVRPWLSKKRTAFVDDAIRAYGAAQEGGALMLDVKRLEDLPGAVIRLGQLCVRVSDLLYTRRLSLQSLFGEELEEVISDTSLPYDADVELRGRSGRIVKVDFVVTGLRGATAVLGLSATNQSSARNVANDICVKWHDLSIPERTERHLTLIDDRHDVYRADDLERIAELSTVVSFSDRRAVAEVLAA